MNRIGRIILTKVIVRISMVAMVVHGIAPWVCAQSSDAPAVASQIDAATYQRVVDENLDLRKEKSRMEAETGELRQRNAALLLDVQDLERKKNQLALIMSQLRTPEETTAELAKLQAEKQALVREIDRLRRALAEVAQPVTNSASPVIPAPVIAPTPGSDLFRKIEKENADLRQEIVQGREALQRETASRELHAKSETLLQSEVKSLSGQLKQVSSERDVSRRREAALKKALEIQARKAFEATRKTEEAKREVRMPGPEVGGQVAPGAQTNAGAVGSASVAVRKDSASVKVIDLRSESSVATLLAEGKAMLVAKRVTDAEAIYLKAYKLEPKNPRVSYNLGVLYGDYLKDTRKAARFYRRYIELAPNAPDVATVRAWLMELDARSKW